MMKTICSLAGRQPMGWRTGLCRWALVALAVWFTMGSAMAGRIVTGDERTSLYLPLLEGKRVALFSNHTGIAGNEHVLDLLLRHGVNVACIFSPEHGFRGTASAGERVSGGVDERTGVPILSLYDGKRHRPSDEDMQKFDVLVADIQDVGLRYYTYYVTLCRLMDACAETGQEVVVLDRPNPNGHYVDGPILDMTYKSGVGWLPIPIVHGMTLGELALMVNGEGWLEGGRKCRLTVIPCSGYSHRSKVEVTIAPSPNLPNTRSVLLYSSLCFFEGTCVSLGRGTDLPFQVFGHPDMKGFPYSFTPRSRPGAIKPPQQDQLCYGRDLSRVPMRVLRRKHVDLSYVIEAYNALGRPKEGFFTRFFELLTGTRRVREMIEAGRSAEEISASWRDDVERFLVQRRPYLLYKE